MSLGPMSVLFHSVQLVGTPILVPNVPLEGIKCGNQCKRLHGCVNNIRTFCYLHILTFWVNRRHIIIQWTSIAHVQREKMDSLAIAATFIHATFSGVWPGF